MENNNRKVSDETRENVEMLKSTSQFEAKLERFVMNENSVKYIGGIMLLAAIFWVLTAVFLDLSFAPARLLFQGVIVFFVLFLSFREMFERKRRIGVLANVAKQLGFARVHKEDEPLFNVRIQTFWSVRQVEQGLESMNAKLFEQGHSRRSTLWYTGLYQSCPMRIIEAEYTIGWGKSSKVYKYFVVELGVERALPGVVIVPIQSVFDGGGLKRVRMESNAFESAFKVYVKEDSVHAFEVLQPDDMEFLLDYVGKRSFMLETFEDKVYLSLFELPDSEAGVIEVLDFSIRISKKLLDI